MKHLEDWSIIGEPYIAPECQQMHLHGKVYGHERHAEGQTVRTSRIVGREGELIRTRSGSLYQLGNVNPDYEELFPGARARVFASIPDSLIAT